MIPMTSAAAPIALLLYLTALSPSRAQPFRRGSRGQQSTDGNMNGEYVLSQTPGGDVSRFPKQYKDYPGGRVGYFDIYGDPTTTLYSQVHWRHQPPKDFPKHIVEAFDGKGLAIIGYEVDMVRPTPKGDVPVPETVIYNHHYTLALVGKGTHFEKVVFEGPDDPRLIKMSEEMGHAAPANMEEIWMAVDDAEEDSKANSVEERRSSQSKLPLPTKQSMDFSNGGEYRKSFHGFAPGYALVLASPRQFQLAPLLIDTWNRDETNLTYPTKFVPGPLPRSSPAPPNASYSGLLECPLTTRVQKVFDASADPPFGQGKGYFRYHPTNQSVDVGAGRSSFHNKCAPQPASDLLAQKNPTCDIRTYAGGQLVCQHMWALLDADQPIPWPDQPLTCQLKFRIWYQEYNESYHKQLYREGWGIASPLEFDVPKCGAGKAGCEQQPDGRWTHTITSTFEKTDQLVYANFHCHSATCLSVSLYRCPSGTEVCNATNGELLCREEAVYGKGVESKYDEPGYIIQPPCLWGSKEHGLEEPPMLTGYVLGVVKVSDATDGHYGEMSLQQVQLTRASDTLAKRHARSTQSTNDL